MYKWKRPLRAFRWLRHPPPDNRIGCILTNRFKEVKLFYVILIDLKIGSCDKIWGEKYYKKSEWLRKKRRWKCRGKRRGKYWMKSAVIMKSRFRNYQRSLRWQNGPLNVIFKRFKESSVCAASVRLRADIGKLYKSEERRGKSEKNKQQKRWNAHPRGSQA